MLAALESAMASDPAVVIVGGEAGVGKTRLVEEAAARARDSGARVLAGSCIELGGAGLPLSPLVDALRSAGTPVRFGELASRYDADTVRWAVTHGHHMRDRFVVSDLVELLGLWDDEFVAGVLDELEALGAGR